MNVFFDKIELDKNIKEVIIIGEIHKRKIIKRKLNKNINIVELDIDNTDEFIEKRVFYKFQKIIVYSERWREIYKKLHKKRINYSIFFRYRDGLVFPPPPFFHMMKSVLWMLKECLCLNIRAKVDFCLVWSLLKWSYGGFFHDIDVTGKYTTFHIGGTRKIPPFRDLSYTQVLWRCIKKNIDLRKKNVLDIGCAEGFFSIELSRLGGKVFALNSPTNSLACLYFLVKYKRIQNLNIIVGFYPEIGTEYLKDVDVVLFLGLLHHLNNLEEAILPILEAKKILILEAVFFKKAQKDNKILFNPKNHAIYDKRIDVFWLESLLETYGYKFKWVKEWEQFVDKPGNNTFSYDIYFRDKKFVRGPYKNKINATRRLIICYPKK